MKSEITFCVGTYNNLNYLKLAIDSVRKYSYYKDSPFVVHAENCDDGTNEWLIENKEKYNLEVYIEEDTDPVRGIGGSMNFCASKVKTKYIMFLHSDFVVSSNWDKYCMDYMKKYGDDKLWVSSYRFEPKLFESSKNRTGTTTVDKQKFGEFYYNFDESKFIEYARKFSEMNANQVLYKGEGVSGLISKKDWDYIGGNDPVFAPASFEDMDLFLRMKLENYTFIMNPKSVVYHFGARGSHFPSDDFRQSSKRQTQAEFNNSRNWLTKWGRYPVKNNNDFIEVTEYFKHRYAYLKDKGLDRNFKKVKKY